MTQLLRSLRRKTHPKRQEEKMTEDSIEIYCDKCEALIATPSFDDCLEDRAFKCNRCNLTTYWKNCLECGTGYYSSDRNKPCPGCQE